MNLVLVYAACQDALSVDEGAPRATGSLTLPGASAPEELPGETGAPPPSVPGLCQAAVTCPNTPADTPQLCTLSVVTLEGEVEYDGAAKVWTRGRSSAGAPKPTLRVELVDDAGANVSVNLLGMGADDDWILHGDYYDRLLVRNKVGFDLYRELGGYAPEGGWCELELQGRPWGVYSLFEVIDRDDDRLPLVEDDGSGRSFIVDLDDENYLHLNDLGYGGWELVYPASDATGGVAAWFDGMEGAATGGHPASVFDWIDRDSAVDIVLLEELLRNNDGWYLSLYAWRDDGGLLNFSPWDLDLTLGQPSYNDNEDPEGWIAYRPALPAVFADDPEFRAALADRWAELREGPLATDAIEARIDAEQATLGDAIDRNFELWPIQSIDFSGYLHPVDSYEEEDAWVRHFLQARTPWIDDNIGAW